MNELSEIEGYERCKYYLRNLLDKFNPRPDLEDEFNKFRSNLEDSDIIVAFPGAFFFIGEHAVMFGQPALYMSIPLYTVIGIKEIETKGINIEIWQRNPENELFEKWLKIDQKEQLQELIENLFKEESIEPKYNVFIIMQIPPRCGLNSSGAFSAGISVCLGLLKGYLTQEKINSWQSNKNLSTLKEDKEFRKTFEIAWEIDRAIQGRSSGIGPFVSLIGVRGEPIIYFLEKNGDKDKKREWFACLLSELHSDIEWLKEAPIALIYSGKIAFTKEALEKIEDESYKASYPISIFSKQLLSKLPIIDKKLDSLATPLKSVLNAAKKRKIEIITEYILDRVYSVLGGFALICISNFSPNNNYATEMMNVYQSVLSSLGISTNEIDEICKNFQEENIGAKLTGSGGGGDVVVFSPMPHKRKDIEEILKRINRPIHYASWEKYDLLEPILYVDTIKHDLGEEEKNEAYIGVISKKLPESPEYSKSGEFSKDAIVAQRNVLKDVEQAISFVKENNIQLDILVLPEYTLPSEKDDSHCNINMELQRIANEENLIIIGGSYLSKDFMDIGLVFVPRKDSYKVPRLNRCKYDPKFFKEGCEIHMFENSRIGDFCVLVCFDALSKEIPKRIKKRYRFGKSFTLIIISCTPAIENYKKICDKLALPSWKSNSDLSLTAHVILADSFHGASYYTAPVRPTKENILNPVKETDNISIYRILVRELSQARLKDGNSEFFYTIDPE